MVCSGVGVKSETVNVTVGVVFSKRGKKMTVFCEAVEYCKRSPSVSILVGFGATYAAYYVLYVVRVSWIFGGLFLDR